LDVRVRRGLDRGQALFLTVQVVAGTSDLRFTPWLRSFARGSV